MSLTKTIKEPKDQALIERIKKAINKQIICPSVNKVYNFLRDNSLLLDECIILHYTDKSLSRAHFYGKNIIMYAMSYGYRGENPKAHYMVCNKDCTQCPGSLRCALNYNGYIYPNTIEQYYKEVE